MHSLRIVGALVGLLLTVSPAWAGEAPHLLANLSRETIPMSSLEEPLGEPAGFFELGGRLFFSTSTGDPQSLDQGILWRTDGSARGTEQISTTLCPSRCLSIEPLTTWRGITLLRIHFDDGFYTSYRLGRTDGTPAGTFLLTGDLWGDSDTYAPQVHFLAGADTFFFSACEGEEGCLLRQSDGTRAGATVLLGTDGLPFFDPAGFTVWRDRLYFVASRGEGGETGLWSTDGTPGGTRLIRNGGDVGPLVATPSRLFFTSGEESEELWATDGTFGGTRRVAEGVGSINASGDAVYFTLRQGGHRLEIWRSDGTRRGTRALTQLPREVSTASHFQRVGRRWLFVVGRDLWTAEEGFRNPAPLLCNGGGCPILHEPPYSPAPGVWLFLGSDADGAALWSTDGTGPGTQRLSDVCAGFQLSPGGPDLFPGPSGKIYFRGCPRDGYTPADHHLWVTDGSPAGTHEVGGRVSAVGFLHGLAYFGSSPPNDFSAELWVTDAKPGLSRRIATLRRYRPDSEPQFQASGNRVLIAAVPEYGRVGLWTSDGTQSGTLPIVDLPKDPERLFTQFLGPAGSRQLFTDVHFGGGDKETPEIWRTDGTPQGTQIVATLPLGAFFNQWTPWNGKLLFAYNHEAGLGGCSLGITDGTTVGTREILFGESSSFCDLSLVPFGSNFLYLDPKRSMTQLFLSDGTAAGTRPIATFEGWHAWAPVRIGNTIFFKLSSESSSQLWQTDGTPAGTRLASPLSSVSNLYAFQGSLYLTAALPDGSGRDRGLFRIRPGSAPVLLTKAKVLQDSWPGLRFAPAGDRLLFAGEARDTGFELWATDGTPAGTQRLRRFERLPGDPFPKPETLVSDGDRVFFPASDGVHGRELWESDGTLEGTRMVADLAPGGYSAIPTPSSLLVANGYLFFAADNGMTGYQPWALPLSP
jgi:ELWxxDGT repeat protein